MTTTRMRSCGCPLISSRLIEDVTVELLKLPAFADPPNMSSQSVRARLQRECGYVYHAVKSLQSYHVRDYDITTGTTMNDEAFELACTAIKLRSSHRSHSMIQRTGLTSQWRHRWPHMVALFELQAELFARRTIDHGGADVSDTVSMDESGSDDESSSAESHSSRVLSSTIGSDLPTSNSEPSDSPLPAASPSLSTSPSIELEDKFKLSPVPRCRVQHDLPALHQFGFVMREIGKHDIVRDYLHKERFLQFYSIATRDPYGLARLFLPLVDIQDPMRIIVLLETIALLAEL
ncbi:hypothetical protein E5Q_04401 [Mixia osmundae IAM 14324]|uniref:Uncharacterized protein n=2 Tax=Mixia osmundae (strain CBS 9802 / IAM 14324 / JCM 22182 / KY 12970) TaxID=764103 RepID=G7E4G2_MIXOS|nr:hypothetical protein E5Q_04401 [Mixia osmundae IAM 14324]